VSDDPNAERATVPTDRIAVVDWVVIGGAGFVGRAICHTLLERGDRVTAIDVNAPPDGVHWLEVDVLTEDVELPAGRVILAQGSSMPRPLRPWTLVLDNAMSTARLRRQLGGRQVTLLSSIEVYADAPAPLTEASPTLLEAVPEEWLRRARALAGEPCPPHRLVDLCRALADLDPTGRWVYALSKAAQELLLAGVPERLSVLRLANVVGAGQWRFLSRLVDSFESGAPVRVTDNVRSFVAVGDVAQVAVDVEAPGVFNVSNGVVALTEVVQLVREQTGLETMVEVVPPPSVDSCGIVDAALLTSITKPLTDVHDMLRRTIAEIRTDQLPLFVPPVPIVLPPRPEQPDLVSARIADALWSGRVRGHRWTAELTEELRTALELRADQQVLPVNSGTNALRLAVRAVARPGSVAICPAFTFHATAEVLRQLGFEVRFADVDPATWTLDPGSVRSLVDDDVAVVVAVDALGNPCDYDGLRSACGGVPLVADSAAALGARAAGVPVGTQADAHAYSMSFAKTVSAGGSGGAVVLPADISMDTPENWLRSSLITEMSAIVGLDSLAAVEALVARRTAVAEIYASSLTRWLVPQQVRPGDRHSFVHWTGTVDPAVGRDRLAAALVAEGISTKPYYEDIRGAGPLPVSSWLHAHALALPMSSELSTEQAERVAAGVRRAARRLR
jgi:dTDP-4-amino-4,6-dideoxygalactose transaminase/nucleoside-diphosphate-sugar epimerase